MKLLVITQIMDRESDFLGFFHNWMEKMAQRVDFVNVICLKMGKHSLPSNVRVWSLGKPPHQNLVWGERALLRIKYIVRFYKYIWQLRKNYNVVFCHMNPIYIVLGGFFWKTLGKKVFLWHNHQCGNLITRIGVFWANNVFHTSGFAFCSRYKKAIKMPAGVDTDLFKKHDNIEKKSNSILFVGRLAPIKGVDILIESANMLDKQGIDFVLTIVGEPGEKEKEYLAKLKVISKELAEKGKIRFLGKVPNYQTPEIYNQHQVFVNLSPAGLFDKTVVEAMACECLVLASSPAFKQILPEQFGFCEKDADDLKNKLLSLFQIDINQQMEWGRTLREIVTKEHSLDKLVDALTRHFY